MPAAITVVGIQMSAAKNAALAAAYASAYPVVSEVNFL
jgi:phosphoribosylcarboxyaminoimidazole (NCAIR) mutase